jgi:hypothetical protein
MTYGRNYARSFVHMISLPLFSTKKIPPTNFIAINDDNGYEKGEIKIAT